MNKVLDIARLLTDEFKNLDLYKTYQDTIIRIDDNIELKNKIIEFKKASFAFESKLMQEQDLNFSQEKEISKMYSEIMLNDDGRVFLETEKKLYELLNNIFEFIGANCGVKPEI